MINKNSVALARTSSTAKVNGDELIERLNGALDQNEERSAEPKKTQYDAIKGIISSNREVAALKKELGLTEYMSTHQMRWLMINAYNGGDEE